MHDAADSKRWHPCKVEFLAGNDVHRLRGAALMTAAATTI
jgi:hypothetical protein